MVGPHLDEHERELGRIQGEGLDRRRQLDESRAKRLHRLLGALVAGLNVAVELEGGEAIGHGDRASGKRLRPAPGVQRQLAKRAGRDGVRDQRRRSAGHRCEHSAAVGDASSQRPERVERRSQRDHPVERDPPGRRLDAADTADRRGSADRTGRVSTGGDRNHARGHGGGRAATGTAGGELGAPRVAHLVGGATAGELVRMQMPDEHHARGAQARPCGAVGVGDVALEHAAGGSQRQALDRVEILQPDRHTAQQRRLIALRGKPAVGLARLLVGRLADRAGPRR